jgi:tetratricopeptide (TPR) repeat protein
VHGPGRPAERWFAACRFGVRGIDKEADNGMKDQPGTSAAPNAVLAQIDYWQKIGLAVAGLLTLTAQLWLAIQKQWQLTVVSLVLAALVVALYTIFSRRVGRVDARRHRFARWSAIATLIAIPLASFIFLLLYSYLPRTHTAGNAIAISRFDGPALPEPYDACRPSTMLARAISDVAERFHRLEVFEVPYSVEPDSRLASFWARSHGWLDAADVIVYGDYSLSKSDDKLIHPDLVTLNPRVDSVPKIPIADKVPPLYSWEFPRRTVPIARLCGSLASAPDATEFVDDARRLALAIVAANLFANQDFEGAQRAVREAKAHLQASSCDAAGRGSPCRGVLNFYLANVDLQLGNFADAEQEYAYAADHLESPAPLISLGELSMRLGRSKEGFAFLDRAVGTDPLSVAALATRALYERDYLRPREAETDLARALNLPAPHSYDLSALSRALYQRGGKGDTACGIAILARTVTKPDFDRRAMIDTYIRYGIWLEGAKRNPEALRTLHAALDLDPYSVKANYEMGVAMRQNGLKPEANAFFRRALYAPSFTDDDFLDRANAANELRALAANPDDARAAEAAAFAAYGRALALNPNAVYAMWDRGRLEDEVGQTAAAERDLRTAAQRHSFDVTLLSTYSAFLNRHGRSSEARTYLDRTRAVLAQRIPDDDAQQWSSSACGYQHMDDNAR